MHQILDCIDAGSDYCPCYLAETNECIMCSQLQGKVFCDCQNWKGVCIYQEYVWNRNQIKERRKNHLCQIMEKREVAPAILLFTIKVNRTLARELNQPGAYVFMREAGDPEYFATPMSIMTADELAATIQIAVQTRGVKTKALRELKKDVIIRGPYWNGLLGLKYLKGLRHEKALIITRGIGQAPALPVAKRLIQADNQVTVLLDKGRAGVNFCEEQFRKLGCKIVPISVLDSKTLTVPSGTLAVIADYINNKGVKLIYSGGSDKLHEGITHLIRELDQEVYLTCSNDGKFCCGEGVCGSCHVRVEDGSRVKTCKCQLSPMSLFKGR